MLVAQAPSPLQRPHASAGFTLIELLVVIAMVAILGALAAPSMRQFAANQELSGATSNLVAAAMTARGTAINRNRKVVIEAVTTDDWTAGWRVYVDADDNESYSVGTDELIASGGPLPDTVVRNTSPPTGCSFKGQFVYRGDGFLTPFAGSLQNAAIPLISTVTGRKRCVVFDKIGRTRVCGDDAGTC
ncbi:GspH/FimT family pseudopilin [Melaminivora suipulveris]|nr:GspH/FimT family pseudopilin [Melaminivora suipulveris]